MHRFGFGSPTGVDLPGEDGGIILPVSQYSGASMGNLPFGQGESVTPMQIATAYAAIANGGILRPPHIVAVDRRQAGHAAGRATGSSREQTALELRKMLRGVFGDGGTASGAAIPGYDMAGKTGTANIAVDGHYSNTRVRRLVRRHGPGIPPAARVRWWSSTSRRASIYGGSVAAPAFQKIVGWAVPVLRDQPARRASRAGASARRRADAGLSSAASRASRSSHWPPTSAIHETALDSGAGRDVVADVAPGALALEQPGLRQRAQVLGDRLARDRQLGGELGRGRRAARRSPAAARRRIGSASAPNTAPARSVVGRIAHAATSAGP